MILTSSVVGFSVLKNANAACVVDAAEIMGRGKSKNSRTEHVGFGKIWVWIEGGISKEGCMKRRCDIAACSGEVSVRILFTIMKIPLLCCPHFR